MKRNRFLCLLLCALLVFTLLPVTPALAEEPITEQFTLAPGGTYYFDLSAQGVPGTVNLALPDITLKWVPFTYAGTVNAYSLDAGSIGLPGASHSATASDRSLFVADYNICHKVSWNDLNTAEFIFGKTHSAGGVDYTLRSLSAGSNTNGQSEDNQRGTPETNEWDQILNKNGAFIKNWDGNYSWGQDTSSFIVTHRALRSSYSARHWSSSNSDFTYVALGWRPALEILNPATLGSDGLKTVTYDMGGNGTLGSGSLTSATVIYTGALTLPEVTDINGFNYIGPGTETLGWYDGSTFYTPGTELDSLPSGTTLTAVVKDAIDPVTGIFDKETTRQADVQTTITWGSASGVSDVKAGSTSIGAGNYNVSGDTLTIKREYLAAQSTGSLVLTVEFNTGAAATLTISITDTTPPPSISPVSVTYDVYAPADISTNIFWNSAASVTDVVYSVGPDTTLYTLDTGNYTVADNDLTIANSFFTGIAVTTGDSLVFTINFDTDATATLTVDVVDSYVPGNNADLSSLSVNGTPVSGFDPSDTGYDVELPYGSSSATVVAIADDINAGVDITQASSLPGTAIVKVTAEDGTTIKTYTINLTIGAAPTISVTSITVTGTGGVSGVQVGNTLQMLVDVLPLNATDDSVTWNIESGSGANISASGLLTATAEGPVTVRATANDGSGVYGEKVITITATPVTTYTITASARGGGVISPSGAVNVTSAGNQTFTITPNSGYRINSVTVDGVNQGAIASYTFTNVTANHTINAAFSRTSSGGSSSGGGSTPSTPQTPEFKADVDIGSGSDITLPVTVDEKSGIAGVDVGNNLMSDGQATVVTVPSVPNVDTYTLGVPVPNLTTPDQQGEITFNTDNGNVTVPSNMLTGVSSISGSMAQIAIAQGDKEALPDEVKAAIGDRPLVQLTLSIDGKQTDWSNPNASVTVSIPYTPTAAELTNPESIVIWYIDGSGNVVAIPNGRYDAATGTVSFFTTHFSDYAVAYNRMSFNDVSASAWYHDAVSFIAAREITSGTGGGSYSPEAKLTRGEFIVLMMRAYGIAPVANPINNFSDAGNTYYTGYLAAAKRLGITAGVGNNMYAPGKEITRQEMFTLLNNALKVIGQLPQGDSGKTLSNFTDAGQIDSWATEAMSLPVETGTVGGSGGKLNPAGTTTRAEMAQVLYNLLNK